MSLRDSGTKSKKFLRVLAALALALSLLTVTGLVAFAAEESAESVPTEDVSAETSAPVAEGEENVSVPATEDDGKEDTSGSATEDEGEKDISTPANDEKVFPNSNYPDLDPNATLGEKFMYGMAVTGIGMSVVFMVLILIMAILYVFKLFATAGAKKPAVQSQAVPAAPVASATPAAPVAASADDEQTIVAIATAAIAAERGESQCAFKVISITKLQ